MTQVHRFRDTAAIGGQYVTAHNARKLGLALVAIADSIEREDFTESPSLTVSVAGFENTTDLNRLKGPVCHVNFRVWPDGDVIALFPVNHRFPQGGSMLGSYQHVGQHGEASVELFDALAQAHPEDYEPLKRELEGLGYVLRVFNYYPEKESQGEAQSTSGTEARPDCPDMPGSI